MHFPSKFPHLNTLLIVLFLALWLYTEIEEYNERHTIYMEFKTFHDAGERFTHSDGEALKAEVAALEARVYKLECADGDD